MGRESMLSTISYNGPMRPNKMAPTEADAPPGLANCD